MQTPKEYKDNLEKGIITKEMLIDCIYSCNKRAKNYRDNERNLRAVSDNSFYNGDMAIYQAKASKEMYYDQKRKLLEYLKPSCIHKEFFGYEIKRIYDYEKEYKEHVRKRDYLRKDYDYDCELGREVDWIEIEDQKQPKYAFYLFYDYGIQSFHTPIEKDDIEKYDLPIIEVDQIITEGDDINDLVSNQFVMRVLEVLKNHSDFCL